MLFINKECKSNASAIGIIGATDGPTSVFISKVYMNEKEDQSKFLSYAAEKIIPSERTFKQVEEYLITMYHAIPHTLLARELNVLKANVIMNCFDYVLDRPIPLGQNPTDEELIAYCKNDTSFSQAREYPAEKLGLEFKAYKLPGIPSQTKNKRTFNLKKQTSCITTSYTENDVIVEMEMKSEYLCICNGGAAVMDDLTIYRGVSEKDIKEQSPRFIAYAYMLKRMGKLEFDK